MIWVIQEPPNFYETVGLIFLAASPWYLVGTILGRYLARIIWARTAALLRARS